MKKLLLICAIAVLIIAVTNAANAYYVTLFEDDFTGTSLSSSWTVDAPTGQVVQNNQLEVTVYGTHAYAKSDVFSVSDWQGIDFFGQWMMPSTAPSAETAEYSIRIYNNDDTSKFYYVGYETWSTDRIHFVSDSVGEFIDRGKPSSWTYFSLRFNDIGWQYYEGSSEDTMQLVKEYASTSMANATNFYIEIGGWDYSTKSNQRVYFDDIDVEADVIPEPGTMLLLGSLATGLFGMAAVRRKRG